MALAKSFDTAALLQACPGDSPAGADLGADDRSDPVGEIEYGPYEKLLDWRREWTECVTAGKSRPDPPERAAGAGSSVLTWTDVVDPCADLLTNRSKDLRAASLLAVAATYRDGVAGLRDGLQVLDGLVSSADYETYPRPLVEGLKSVAAVANTLEDAVVTSSLTAGHGRRLCLLDLQVAEHLRDTPEDADRYREAGAATLADFDEELSQIGVEAFRDYQQTVAECKKLIEALVEVGGVLSVEAAAQYDSFANARAGADDSPWSALAEPLKPSAGGTLKTCSSRTKSYVEALGKCSPNRLAKAGVTPEDLRAEVSEAKTLFRLLQEYDRRCDDLRSYYTLTERLEKCLRVVAPFAEAAQQRADAAAAAGADPDGVASGDGRSGRRPTGQPNSREEAIQQLEWLRDYFRASEPHTVMPYILERAVAWGRMSFPQLLAEVVGDHSGAATALLNRANVDIAAGNDDDTPMRAAPAPVVKSPSPGQAPSNQGEADHSAREDAEKPPEQPPSERFG